MAVRARASAISLYKIVLVSFLSIQQLEALVSITDGTFKVLSPDSVKINTCSNTSLSLSINLTNVADIEEIELFLFLADSDQTAGSATTSALFPAYDPAYYPNPSDDLSVELRVEFKADVIADELNCVSYKKLCADVDGDTDCFDISNYMTRSSKACRLDDIDGYDSVMMPDRTTWIVTCSDGWEMQEGMTGDFGCLHGTLIGNYSCIDIDECSRGTHDCDFDNDNEVCLNDPEGSYTCDCRPDFVRGGRDQRCVPDVNDEPDNGECSPIGGDVTCKAEFDPVTNVTWPETKASCDTNWMQCPPRTTGNSRRTCGSNGEWGEVDTTYCSNERAENISRKAKEIATTDDALEVVEEIESVLLLNDIVLGGDLLKAVEIMNEVLDRKPLNLSDDVGINKRFSLGFVKVVNNLLDETNENHWTRIHENKGVPYGAAAVFQSLERFDSDVGNFVREHNGSVYVRYKNIEYQACVIGNCTDKMESVVVRHVERSRVARSVSDMGDADSEAIVPSNVLADYSNSTVSVVYVYRNLGDILPTGNGKVRETRGWVSTITAVTKVKKVNSAVVSVVVYSSTGNAQNLGSLTLTFTHKHVGYDAKCAQMVYGSYASIWNMEKCKLVEPVSSDYSECECYEPGKYAVVMTMGQPTEPFTVASKKTIAMIGHALSILMLVLALTFITLSRYTTDRYIVLWLSVLSFIPMPALNIVSLFTESNSAECAKIALGIQVTHLVNLAWTMNLSIEVYLRLALYRHTNTGAKFAYFLTGFAVPAVLYCILSSIGQDVTGVASCWSSIEIPTIKMLSAISVVTILVSVCCLTYTHNIYTNEKKKYEPEEWRQFWEELRSVMQFLLAATTCWISSVYTAATDDPMLGYYTTAFASFVFASDVFLSACATNSEMVTAIRIHFENDEDYKAALAEVKETENARFDARRRNRERVKEIKQRLKVKENKVKQKSSAIRNVFTEATKQSSKVTPIIVDEDFSI